ncbi:hypothetical protein LCY76_23780 [Fictibacillus sp. KIGAM418]|uniref:Lipoprotein n=1 Tax=Fictibacillus marinisediminis TaxID=2878389 RepID=A0A9X1XG75_9BACL|nr:hypothetical protein [Fictibacillus marinisediminis]MCK6259591.1 hypothetical protein [Fictibacillus marinisediminis]
MKNIMLKASPLILSLALLTGCGSGGDIEESMAVQLENNQKMTEQFSKYQDGLKESVLHPEKQEDVEFWLVEPKEKLDTSTVISVIDGDTFKIGSVKG